MRKLNKAKLFGTVMALLAAFTMIVAGTYAWLTISKNPTAEGIQVMVGGGSTIYLAPDVTDENGNHYPGKFSDSLLLSQGDGSVGVTGLKPVSTADGLNWFLPTYYTPDDTQVQNYEAYIGQVKPIQEFERDTQLQYANLGKDEDTGKGSYLYMDFWVVSVNSDFDLHVSTSDEYGVGSYAIALQEVVKTEAGGYALKTVENPATECLRVGFLVNQNAAKSGDMAAYAKSSDFADQYRNLRGNYQEKGQSLDASQNLNTFTIYEPNADLHTAFPELDGKYVRTDPVGLVNEMIQPVTIEDRLCPQLASTWAEVDGVFQAAVLQAEKNGVELTESNLREYFYKQYLQSQTSPYVKKGDFIEKTIDLYLNFVVENNKIVTDMSEAATATASTTKIVTLDRNVPQRVRMFIWLEGQDVDCTGNTNADQFALSIELAGGPVQ